MDKDDTQVDLFGDFQRQTEVMKSIGGYFLGHFSRDPEDPVVRESEYFDTEKEANQALSSGKWKPPGP